MARVATALTLILLAVVLLLLVSLIDRLGAAPRALGNLSSAAQTIGGAAQGAAQSARDVLDPTHPPRGTLSYDAELDELRITTLSSQIAPHGERDLLLARVEKRVGAETADTAQFAIVLDKLKTPKENRILGVVVSRSDDARERILYKAQVFQIARRLYKVNWVQFEPPQIAVGRLRSQDGQVQELAFSVD